MKYMNLQFHQSCELLKLKIEIALREFIKETGEAPPALAIEIIEHTTAHGNDIQPKVSFGLLANSTKQVSKDTSPL
jgi:hypothetical protein